MSIRGKLVQQTTVQLCYGIFHSHEKEWGRALGHIAPTKSTQEAMSAPGVKAPTLEKGPLSKIISAFSFPSCASLEIFKTFLCLCFPICKMEIVRLN